mmetsp:Transcript_9199/g.20377  ORF Transcript_9199/g.20377 Transcript_9199/m.20377 type:complete len:209 (-) Transcript_9199:655-1281(-)
MVAIQREESATLPPLQSTQLLENLQTDELVAGKGVMHSADAELWVFSEGVAQGRPNRLSARIAIASDTSVACTTVVGEGERVHGTSVEARLLHPGLCRKERRQLRALQDQGVRRHVRSCQERTHQLAQEIPDEALTLVLIVETLAKAREQQRQQGEHPREQLGGIGHATNLRRSRCKSADAVLCGSGCNQLRANRDDLLGCLKQCREG